MSDRTEEEREAARAARDAARRAAAERDAPPTPEAPPPAPAAPVTDEFDHIEPQAGAPGMPHRPVTIPRPRRRRGSRVVLLALVGVVLVVGLYVLNGIFTPLKGEGSGRVVVRIPQGSSARAVGDLLERRGVVGSGLFFSLRAGIAGERDALRAGTFTLRRDMSNGAALDVLTTPPAAAPTVSVTLPEGPSRREFAVRVRAQGVRGDYLAASRRSDDLDPRRYGAPKGARTLEGFLFPATYELRRPAAARTLVHQQLTAFKRAFATVDLRRARTKNLTAFDVLTIASLIEREVSLPRERPLVAAVIYNRLKQGIPLGIDATTRYAVGNWTRPLRQSELASPSRYNTRNRQGLPPGPIGNPGLDSIRAAAHPAAVRYLYYVVKPCGNGAHSFSSTEARFQRDVAAYNAKREALGGKDPSHCPS